MGRETVKARRSAMRELHLVDPYEAEVQAQVFEYLKVCPIPYPVVAQPILRPEGGLAVNPVALTLYDCAYAVPNGTKLGGTPSQRARYMAALKKQGLKVGVSDVVIACPTQEYHGMYMELKRVKSSPISDEQELWAAIMRQMGYAAEICIGFDAAKAFIDSVYRKR